MRYWISFVLLYLPLAGYAANSTCSQSSVGIKASTPTERFEFPTGKTIDTSEVVIDKVTGLVWARCEVGASWDPDLYKQCQGDATSMNWEEALTHVKNLEGTDFLGYTTGWRLPNVKELASIVEHDCTAPSINGEVFKGLTTASTSYTIWSSSPSGAMASDEIWVVNFASGQSSVLVSGESTYVRLVRDSIN